MPYPVVQGRNAQAAREKMPHYWWRLQAKLDNHKRLWEMKRRTAARKSKSA